MKEIYLAGGCFWGVEGYFEQLDGVLETSVGYANGRIGLTTYEMVKLTDHAETVHIKYDPEKISLTDLLKHYFRIIDPFSVNRQGNDIGRQYRTGIYYVDEKDAPIAQAMLDEIQQEAGDRKVAVELAPVNNYVTAETYHQDYLKKNPNGYCHIDLSLAQKPL